MTKKEDLEALVAEISKKEKFISLLVCAAGIAGPKAEPESSDASELKDTLFNGESFSEWSNTYNTNVSSVYVSLHAEHSPTSLTHLVHDRSFPSPTSSQQQNPRQLGIFSDCDIIHVWNYATCSRTLQLQCRQRSNSPSI